MAFVKELNPELSIHEIIAGNTIYLDEFLKIFVELFPQYSYRTDRLTKTAQNTAEYNPLFIEHQWLIRLRHTAVAMSTFKYLPQRNLGIGVHLAIKPAFRNYTFGPFTRLSEIIIEETKKQFIQDAETQNHPIPPGYIIEVVEPKLINKYAEYGFQPFDIPYQEPTISMKNKAFVDDDDKMDSLEFHPAVIGIIPIGEQKVDTTDPCLLQNAIDAFLFDYYELEEEHWVVQQARKAIPKCSYNLY